jgi:hypothetical protein
MTDHPDSNKPPSPELNEWDFTVSSSGASPVHHPEIDQQIHDHEGRYDYLAPDSHLMMTPEYHAPTAEHSAPPWGDPSGWHDNSRIAPQPEQSSPQPVVLKPGQKLQGGFFVLSNGDIQGPGSRKKYGPATYQPTARVRKTYPDGSGGEALYLTHSGGGDRFMYVDKTYRVHLRVPRNQIAGEEDLPIRPQNQKATYYYVDMERKTVASDRGSQYRHVKWFGAEMAYGLVSSTGKVKERGDCYTFQDDGNGNLRPSDKPIGRYLLSDNPPHQQQSYEPAAPSGLDNPQQPAAGTSARQPQRRLDSPRPATSERGAASPRERQRNPLRREHPPTSSSSGEPSPSDATREGRDSQRTKKHKVHIPGM